MTSTTPLMLVTVFQTETGPVARTAPAYSGLEKLTAAEATKAIEALEAALIQVWPAYKQRFEATNFLLARFDDVSARAVEKLKVDHPTLFED